MAKPAFIVIAVLLAVGVIVAIILSVTLSKGKNSANGNGNPSLSGSGSRAHISDTAIVNQANTTAPEPSSDPDAAVAAFTYLAIGDWGATIEKAGGSCCSQYRKNTPDSVDYKTDYFAQENVAALLGMSAAQIKPTKVLGHGDNFYWDGVGPKDIAVRMQTNFEEVYVAPALKGVTWINVAGNHDIGGSAFICGDSNNAFRECADTAEMLKYLDLKFTLQAQYVSPNGNRWTLKDHYYKDSFQKNGVSVDVFNLDTNYADNHGYREVCCQCYGYNMKANPGGSTAQANGACKNVSPGDALCAGGSVDMFNACAKHIKSWWDDSLAKATTDMAQSNATFKVVNTHFSPHYHMSDEKMRTWYKLVSDNKVHLWLNGHTHGFNHDISVWGTHFVQNGAGGGIQSESAGLPPDTAKSFVTSQWTATGHPYGFFELSFSKDWLKVQFVTFDSKWIFSTKRPEVIQGGLLRDHCWNIPRTLGKGKECAKKS